MSDRRAFRGLVIDAIGGGWGQDQPSDTAIPVAVVRGTDFASVAAGDVDQVPRRYEERKKAERRLLRANDLVIEISGGSRTSNQSTGRSLLVSQELLDLIGGNVIPASFCRRVRIDERVVDPKYAYYALQDMYKSGRAALYEHQSTGISNFQFEFFLDNELVYVPPLSEQRRVVEVLNCLDSRINLNHRMNATLERIAVALFRAWFVDFEPVRAKAEGREPVGVDRATSDLFPNELVDSELGEIPAEWQAVPLSAVFSVGIGGAWGEEEPSPKSDVSVHCLRGIDCHDIAERRRASPPTRYISAKQAASRALAPGVVLVEGSGSFCGRSLLWINEWTSLFRLPIGYSNFVKRLDPVVSTGQALVAWMQMRRAYSAGGLDGFRTGTAFPNFDVGGLLNGISVLLPPEPVADAYLKLYRQLLRPDLILQSETLASLRDLLLPRLLSGELRVAEAEALVP